MLEYTTRQKVRHRLYSRPVFFALLVLAVVTAKGAWSMHEKLAESEANLALVSQKAEAMREREAELQADIERLGTAKGVEEEIRKKFSVVKEGEEMVVLVDSARPADDNAVEEKGFFGRAWGKVKGWFGHDEDAVSVEAEDDQE